MTNLADLIPAGGGQNNTDFVADGNISSGAPVVLTSDGTVTSVTGAAQSIGSESVFNTATVFDTGIAYDSNENKVVVAYKDNGNSNYGTAIVGTISGTSVSWGTPVVFDSTSCAYIVPVFDSDSNKIVINYQGSSNWGISIVGTVSGTSISFGSYVAFHSGITDNIGACFDSSNNKVVIAYRDNGASNEGEAVVGTVSGTAISFGSTAQFETGITNYSSPVFDSNSNKVVISYSDGSDSGTGKAVVGTVSGTSISYGTIVSFNTGDTNYIGSAFDSNSNKVVTVYRDDADSQKGKGIVGTVAGTDITFGTEVVYSSVNVLPNVAAFDSDTNQVIVAYTVPSASYAGKFVRGTVSGTSISFSAEFTYASGNTDLCSICYDTGSDRIVIVFQDTANSNYGTATVIQVGSTNLTSTNLLGLAPSAISDTATGTINTWGSRCETTKIVGTGLSMGATSQFSSSNLPDINASQAVFDSTNNKMIIVYDGAGSGAGYGIVGTITGTSISYGTAVQYSGGNAQYSRAAYDSTNEKVVVAYRDTNNSNYGTAAVGTVSGTSISWGTPVVFDSNATSYMDIAFDSTEGKVLITWKASTAYATSIVGTVSGTSISYGAAVILDLSYGYNKGSVTYDPNAQKHLYIAERTAGTVTDSYVGTVSGTAISWGSAVSLTTAKYFYSSFSAYEAPSQKIGVVFTNATDSTLGTMVATISGSSVSYGALVNVGAGAYTAPGVYYDSGQSKFIAQGVLSNDLLAYIGTISGTAISWGSSQTVVANADFGYGVGVPGYDTNAGKGLFQWANAGDTAAVSGVATVGDLDLTIGTDYYVQTDGSVSTDTGGQLIGKAIATNQINIKDYTG